MKEKSKISKVIVWSNGMVTVFDQHGKQMPKFQGKFVKKKIKILEEIGGRNNVTFSSGAWKNDVSEISRGTFERL